LGYRNYLEGMIVTSKKTTRKNNDILKQAFMDEQETSTLSSPKNNEKNINEKICNNDNNENSINYKIPINLNDSDCEE